jgi:peptidoglycan/xylan/chitin deacetylase (PgdA/CDA1 family)
MIRNFLFHRVNPKRDKLWDPMDVSLFEKCVEHIANKYEVVLLEDLAFSDRLHQKNRFATIMFDDGYQDNLEYAAPVLARHKCKASFYVVTDCIDKNTLTWTHLLEHVFQFTNKTGIELDFDFLPDDLKIKDLKTTQQRIQYVSRLKPFLKTISHNDRTRVLDKVVASFNDVEFPKLMMTWQEVNQLKSEGHYIGSHTITHCMLGTMHNEQQIKKELMESAYRIQEKTGHAPVTISYPVGSYNETTKRLAQEAGYKIGLAVKQTLYEPDKHDRFEIPRIELYNEPWWKTRLRISNTLETIKTLVGYK